MIKEDRLNFIVSELKVRNRVLLTDLAQRLDVSEDTVRRDLNQLHEEGKIRRVHGGAISTSFHLYSYKEQEIYAYQNKSIIARKVHSLFKSGQIILMSGGTTNLEVARLIPNDLSLTICTPSLLIAMQLSERPNIETILIGGKLLPESQIAVGGDATLRISQIKADLCLLGTGHFDLEYGFSEIDYEVVQLKKTMIRSSRKVVAVTIAEKLGSIQRFKICETLDIHCLVTELEPSDTALAAYRKAGLEVI